MSTDTAIQGRDRGGWTSQSRAYVERVKTILDGLADYWPLTLRQVYYQLVAAGDIANALSEYSKLSRVLAHARIDELVPWEAMEDRSRSTLVSGGWQSADAFLRDELARFLEGYRRDLLQGQPYALEVWIEKDALSRVCHRAAFPYCVPVVVAKGFASVSYAHECRLRVQANARAGKTTVILYFGDLDPSGWEMLPAMLKTLQGEMALGDLVHGVRCALLPEHVEAFNLPHSIDALKQTDSRAAKYIKRFGTLAVELDALPPPTLERFVREAIREHLDLSQFREEAEAQETESARLADLREQVRDFLEGGAQQ